MKISSRDKKMQDQWHEASVIETASITGNLTIEMARANIDWLRKTKGYQRKVCYNALCLCESLVLNDFWTEEKKKSGLDDDAWAAQMWHGEKWPEDRTYIDNNGATVTKDGKVIIPGYKKE